MYVHFEQLHLCVLTKKYCFNNVYRLKTIHYTNIVNTYHLMSPESGYNPRTYMNNKVIKVMKN